MVVDGFARLTSGARAWAGRVGGGAAVVWYGLFTLAAFVVSFAAVFPHDLMLQRALTAATAGTSIRVVAERGGLGWTLAYGVDALRVEMRDGDGHDPLLLAQALRVAPSRLGLLRGTPYPIALDATLYGGSVRGTFDPRPASFRVDAKLEGVDLARYTGLRPWLEGTVRGRLEGAVELDGNGRGPAAAAGDVRLRIDGLTLEGTKVRGIVVPDLHFSDVHLTGTVKNGRLQVEEVVADGQELGLRGDGDVLLREPLGASPLNLSLVVSPAPGAPDGLKVAVGMLPGASADGGARRISVGGTLGRPTLR